MKVLSVETLKRRILKGIKGGNHKTQYIIEYCKAELFYSNFCKAIAELQCEGVIEYKSDFDDSGYYLR